ncbi:TwdlQ [Drosophila busckii]|uniref:TwdlQ n=1 Tax=Drosophila busckii TaxID=30019 RepID=A0A0M4ETE9_DROBS|nr:uncharacterized protein LOC108601361 [Drosophila busckii]ALC46130.1 TwdlQ [Drosophila busckii]
MHAILLLYALVAATGAAKLGYNYQHGRLAGLIDTQATGFSATAAHVQQQQQQQQQAVLQPVADEFNKEFFTYAAPEEDFIDHEAAQQLNSALKRNLRVLFIKSPEHQALTNAALQLAKLGSEQRTAIYVLTKQPDIDQLAQRVQQQSNSHSPKPEVHFVKYRTPEDAQRAQELIQQQFNALGGTSHSSDEGVAPVLDFSSAPASAADAPQSKYLPAA